MGFTKGGRKHRRGGQVSNGDSMGSTSSAPASDEEYPSSMSSTPMSGGMHKMRGGQSAASFQANNVGGLDVQWKNVFDNSQTMTAPTGNGLWNVALDKNVANTHIDSTLGKYLQGGKRRSKKGGQGFRLRSGGKHRKHHSRKGGNLMGVVGQAAVPFALLALQNKYSKRKHRGGRKTRRHHRR